MTRDKRVTYAISASVCLLLLLILFIPTDEVAATRKIIAAAVLIPAAAITSVFIKKRTALSMHKGTVALLMTAAAALCVVLMYLSGIRLGFNASYASYAVGLLASNILPVVIIIVTAELIRRILLAQSDRLASVICYVLGVLADIIAVNAYESISGYGSFMNVVGLAVFPAVTANLLYGYIAKRFGALPNILYRCIFTLYPYILPAVPALSESLLSVIRMLVPILVYAFISSMFEEKRRYALGRRGRFAFVIPVIAVILMISVVMLISCQFRFGVIVIASDSMTGEMEKGDAVIFEQYEDQTVTEGQVIVFEKDGVTVVHRVVEIERINGVNRYYTKGDANEDRDYGYITDASIVGIARTRVMFVGYPTIWLHGLVSKALKGG